MQVIDLTIHQKANELNLPLPIRRFHIYNHEKLYF